MVHMRRWCNAAMALVLSLVLVLGMTHLTEAKPFRLQQAQRPQVECRASVSVPQLGKGRLVLTTGSINCSSAVSHILVDTRLEMKVVNTWVTLNHSSSNSLGTRGITNKLRATASAACSPQQTMAYRGVIYGGYTDASGKSRSIHETPSSEVSLKCE